MPKAIPAKKKTIIKKETKEFFFPVVGIGASSGGLEAVTALLKYLPSNTGMAFIFIQHLSPNYKSVLVSLLTKVTKMNVTEIKDMELIKPNHFYIIPNDKGIEVTTKHIHLIPRSKNDSPNLSIDFLFSSLAKIYKENSIGVILSGNATDGTMGLKAIRQEGGITFAQDNSAKYSGMPTSAIGEGVADFVLSPKKIADELVHISKQALRRKKNINVAEEHSIHENNTDLKIIIQLLYKATGADFSHYKMNTLKRRIFRRMFLNHLGALKQYAKLLKSKSSELDILYNDLLINVTDFFRDTETAKYLKNILFPKLLSIKEKQETLRIWVVACSTGQEAYSIAMLLVEILGSKLSSQQIQIFATDLSEPAIKKARAGEYTAYEVKAISPKRLERFFTKVDGHYRIIKTVRDLCAFAPHNILSDPPFSKLDFISCCNLLIYLDAPAHKKVLTTFQYALNDGGSLMLGRSESIGLSHFFSHTNSKYKIYTRKKVPRVLPDLKSHTPHSTIINKKTLPRKGIGSNAPITESEINSVLFARYIPTYVVINHAMDILQFKGATSTYLEHLTGKATLNILNMARPEIAFELRSAIQKSIKTTCDVHTTNIEIKDKGICNLITLDVIPLGTQGDERLLMIVFTQQKQTAWQEVKSTNTTSSSEQVRTLKRLKEELSTLKTNLVLVTEENEKSTKILQAANEEILSSNEEFQSMNEELETSKEEIESANEEITATNQELLIRNEQLSEAYNLSEAIFATVHEPMIILDADLRVKSVNKAFFNKFRINQVSEEGKLFSELGNRQWDIPDLRQLLANVLLKNTPINDFEITHSFPNIGLKTMLLNARRIEQKTQNTKLILLAFTDITHINQLQQIEKEGLEDIISIKTAALEESYSTLKEKHIALEQINKELETFAFISSHDLQEPLRKIKNFSSCLLQEESKNLSDTGKDYLTRMYGTVNRMQMLLNDLLEYTLVKKNNNYFEKTDLHKLTKEILSDFKEELNEKKAIIKVEGACLTSVARFQYRQLMQNLINNSLKFSSPKRKLRIVIKFTNIRGSRLNNVDLLPKVNYCHITFTDNGIGFDPQYKTRIFEVFQRLHGYDEYQGTGIGLAICKRIAENHNGIIVATGKLNKGAKFDIYIPLV